MQNAKRKKQKEQICILSISAWLMPVHGWDPLIRMNWTKFVCASVCVNVCMRSAVANERRNNRSHLCPLTHFSKDQPQRQAEIKEEPVGLRLNMTELCAHKHTNVEMYVCIYDGILRYRELSSPKKKLWMNSKLHKRTNKQTWNNSEKELTTEPTQNMCFMWDIPLFIRCGWAFLFFISAMVDSCRWESFKHLLCKMRNLCRL